ncbi:MAG: 4-hydroxy-tetrahydrodipicolinate synthase [Halobacteriales archaeon]|nr:4-hydroxy-tetrahydrodipicolinate synthase [Halobacteriales archaeon]
MEITEGVYPALVTPFDSDGEVDYDALGEVIDHVEDAGVDGVVPCGSTGESATLTHEEHKKVVEYTVENAETRVIAGSGSNSTHEAVELTEHADEAGADGALLISPYYNIPNDRGLVKHYEKVADEVDIPLLVYNVPGRTGHNIPDDVIVELAEYDGIAGIKEASGDIDKISRLCARTEELDFDVVSGDDSITLPLLSVGGTGVISVTANIFPRSMCELVESAREGDYERAREIHAELMPVFDAMFKETNPIPVKIACEELGLCRSELRLPLSDDVPEESVEKILSAVREYEGE